MSQYERKGIPEVSGVPPRSAKRKPFTNGNSATNINGTSGAEILNSSVNQTANGSAGASIVSSNIPSSASSLSSNNTSSTSLASSNMGSHNTEKTLNDITTTLEEMTMNSTIEMAKRKDVHKLQRTASESLLVHSRRNRANTVGFIKSPQQQYYSNSTNNGAINGVYTQQIIHQQNHSQSISQQLSFPSQSQFSNPQVISNGSINDSNVEKSNAYFRRLSSLPLKKQPVVVKPKFMITQVSRKLLFVFSEIYSSLKRFNIIGNNDISVQERMAYLLSMAKRQINNLVEVLETTEDGSNVDDSMKSVSKAIDKNISVFKEVLLFLSDNMNLFTSKTDVCFIRMLLLSLFGCFNEICNANRILMGSAQKITSMPVYDNNYNSKSKVDDNSDTKNIAAESYNINDEKINSFSNSVANAENTDDYKQLKNDNKEVTAAVNFDGNENNNSSVFNTPIISGSNDTKNSLSDARVSVIKPKDETFYNSLQMSIKTVDSVSKLIIETLNKYLKNDAISEGHYNKVEELLYTCNTIKDISLELNFTLKTLSSNKEDEQDIKYKKRFLSSIDTFINKVIIILTNFKILMDSFPELTVLRSDMSLLSKTAKNLISIFRPTLTQS